MTSEFQTFRLVAHLKTPAIIQGDLTLESLLAAAVHQESGKLRQEALDQVPIETIATPHGVIWMASAVMFDGRFKLSTHTVVRGRHFSEMGPDFYDPNPRARIDGWAIEQDKGPYKRLMNNYPIIEASRLVWYAKGNMRQCKRLFETQGWIGKRRGSGMGEVAEITVQPWSGNPVVDTNGMVRRPVSIPKLAYLPAALTQDRQRRISTVDSHPAWLHEPELCAVPPSRMEPRELPEMFFED